MNWLSFIFAHTLKAHLRGGAVETPNAIIFRVTGKVDAPAVLARIEVALSQDFDDVVRQPPQVWCREPWMREGEEWHNDPEGGICWVLKDEWRDVLSPAGRRPRDLVHAGTTWLLKNVTSLISRHYYAHLVGLKHWLKEWEAWGHYEKGAKEYEREQQRRLRGGTG